MPLVACMPGELLTPSAQCGPEAEQDKSSQLKGEKIEGKGTKRFKLLKCTAFFWTVFLDSPSSATNVYKMQE